MSKKKFFSEINYRSPVICKEFEVEAETAEEAWLMIQAISEENKPEGYVADVHSIETGDTLYIPIGICETSGKPIWEHSEYYQDEDGIMWLKEHDKMEAH
jgi:hypothetical protein